MREHANAMQAWQVTFLVFTATVLLVWVLAPYYIKIRVDHQPPASLLAASKLRRRAKRVPPNNEQCPHFGSKISILVLNKYQRQGDTHTQIMDPPSAYAYTPL